MKNVLPVIIVCGVGILACLGYIVAVCIRSMRRSPRKREFEIDEDVLVIKLNKNKNRKK